MHFVDFVIFTVYMAAVLGVGYYFFRKNKDSEDYYVGGRNVSPGHIGMSIVATDVGGGFSIGLGGLGFTIGLAGSWLLFTGLAGAWLSAIFILPRIKSIDSKLGLMTYPDFLRIKYNENVALIASVISGIGYLGFTGAQVLAGAKLASATLITKTPFNLDPLHFALYIIAIVIIGYTVMGGIKAVIFTDTIQWIILLTGLIGFAIPLSIYKLGGLGELMEKLPQGHFNIANIPLSTFINWMVTIIPIWLVAMTLYQRIYACRDTKDAKKAWYIAGIFEYPIMAFMGAFLGMCARVIFPEAEPEMGLPLLVKHVLPIGITGIVVAAYFSAIMSTADSCLMASSGNFVNDIIQKYLLKQASDRTIMWISQIVTFILGVLAILIAASFTTVLNAILYAYGFIVSGLFIPTLVAYFAERVNSTAALWSMISGGSFTVIFKILNIKLFLNLDATFYGILVSAFVYFVLIFFVSPGETNELKK